MSLIPASIKAFIETELRIQIQEVKTVTGGSINKALLIHSDRGFFFLKYNSGNFARALFQTESRGLRLLANAGHAPIPQIHLEGSTEDYSFLVLEYLAPGREDQAFWETFGRMLAHVHQITAPQFGLDHDNFIGRLPQSNQKTDHWEAFYWEQRLLPQIKMAIDTGRISPTEVKTFEDFYKQISPQFPKEIPALIHGDLWSGNYLATTEGLPVLIDPAVCYAHREMDLAMTRLFGGFSPSFYAAYQEAFPLAPGFEERVSWYQLYYLMVHVNLFGGSYWEEVRQILRHRSLKQ